MFDKFMIALCILVAPLLLGVIAIAYVFFATIIYGIFFAQS